jgi:hypothetical protein
MTTFATSKLRETCPRCVQMILFSPPVGWRVYSPLMCLSVRLSVTTERLSKLRKITGKKQARFRLGPLWPPVTGSKNFTVVRGAFFLTCDHPLSVRVSGSGESGNGNPIQKTSSNVGGGWGCRGGEPRKLLFLSVHLRSISIRPITRGLLSVMF